MWSDLRDLQRSRDELLAEVVVGGRRLRQRRRFALSSLVALPLVTVAMAVLLGMGGSDAPMVVASSGPGAMATTPLPGTQPPTVTIDPTGDPSAPTTVVRVAGSPPPVEPSTPRFPERPPEPEGPWCNEADVALDAFVAPGPYRQGDAVAVTTSVRNLSSGKCRPPSGVWMNVRDPSGQPRISFEVYPISSGWWEPGESYTKTGSFHLTLHCRPDLSPQFCPSWPLGTYSASVTWVGTPPPNGTSPPAFLPAPETATGGGHEQSAERYGPRRMTFLVVE